MTTYVGDSYGKKLSRAMVWLHASQASVAFNSDLRGALVLAGHGGDLATASGFQISPSLLHAADTCSEAADFCSALYPKAQVYTAKAGDVAEDPSVRFNMAHLDFCGGLTAENIESCYRVAKAMEIGRETGSLYVTMMRGREPKDQRTDLRVALPRAERRRILKNLDDFPGAQLYRGRPTFSTSLLLDRADAVMRATQKHGHTGAMPVAYAGTHAGQVCFAALNVDRVGDDRKLWRFYGPRSGKATPLGKLVARSLALGSALEALLRPHGRSVVMTMCLGYHSVSNATGGTPFMSVGFRVCRTEQWHDVMAFLQETMPEHGWPQPSVDLLDAEASISSLQGLAVSLLPSLPPSHVASVCDVPESLVRQWADEATKKTHGLMGPRSIRALAEHAHLKGYLLRANPGVVRVHPGWGELSGWKVLDS